MGLKYNIKQRTKTIQGLRSFKDTLPKKIKKILVKKGHTYSETLDNWRYIVGNELFEVCYPKSFKNSNRLGTSCLNIMVKRGHEVDMEYSKRDILNKSGENEVKFLNHLEKLIDNKTTNADHMINKFSKAENLTELYDK